MFDYQRSNGLLTLLGFVVLANMPFSNAQSEGWILHRSPEGRFKVEVPGPLSHKTVEASTDLGVLATEVYYFQPEEDSTRQQGLYFYQVSYCDFPETALDADSSDLVSAFFSETVEAAAQSVGGEVRYADEDMSLGYPGYRWRIDYRDGEVAIRTRAVIVGNRYYSWQVVSGIRYSLSPETGRFLESFGVFE